MTIHSRKLRFDMLKMGERFSNHLDEFPIRYAPKLISKFDEAGEMGYFPTSEKEVKAHIEKLRKLPLRVVDDLLLSMPHPTRSLDFGGAIDGIMSMTADASSPVLSAAYNPNMSLTDIEMFCVSFKENPYLSQRFPQFVDNIREYGAGGLFIQLLPILHYLRSDPIFTITAETCQEAESIDISKGIDTSYLRSPVPNSYFHLEKTDLQVHDPSTDFHILDGFYLVESENHCYDFDKVTLEALGLDATKPYRAMQIVFTGKPKGTALNDTLSKIDIFLQDGMPIDEMIQRTLAWYDGKVTADESGTFKMGSLDNKIIDLTNLDVAHNVKLVKDAINYIAYLSFANFRKQQSNKLQEGIKQVMSKTAKNRRKAAKKLRGISDEIIIQTNNPIFKGAGQSAAGTGYKMSAHFRRGFIRNQRYGSGDNIEHKPKFIAPTLVAQGDSDEVQAKNYRVK
ncbi:hypothetical protein [Vibrio agarivorans]|uniref:hypothetical protein n=1 Tax=Vibrio agarivorans TaxID=153622 RepID=UPI0025B44B1B|nr:hypothetical protein [Vibrio agarivorans]MDN3661044.1 hypothetical protein [Vibrio agarivorans]